jgi:hypothetical protein
MLMKGRKTLKHPRRSRSSNLPRSLLSRKKTWRP